MEPGITLAAHAKVNLILRVLDRDASGYHRLETVFQRLALADEVTVGPASVNSLDITWDGPPADLGPAEKNLAWRAAAAYRAATGWPSHWRIRIIKRIPVQGGLGGGSADAAAVLRALNALAARPIEPSALARLAARLGADVPFLVSGESLAIGRGYGDELDVLPALPPAETVVVVPPFGIGTADAYASLDRARETSGAALPGPAAKLTAARLARWSAVADLQRNDFEPTVFSAFPELGQIRTSLEGAGALIARLSGSGSALFGIAETPGTFGSLAGAESPFSGMRLIRTSTL